MCTFNFVYQKINENNMKQLLFKPFYFPVLLCIFSLSACASDTTKVVNNTGSADDVILKLPEGFKATVFADGLGHARHIAVNTNGDVYVKLANLKNGKGIYRLRDTNGDG